MMARQMVNFVYLIGDRDTGEARRRRSRPTPSRTCSTSWRPTACASPACSAPTSTPTTSAARWAAGRSRASARCSRRCRCRCTSRPTSCPGSSARRASGRADLVGHDSGDVVRVGRRRGRADPHPRPHAGQPVLPGRRPAGGRRHPLPRGVRADRLPGLGPAGHVRVASTPGWPGCPTTPSSSRVTSTRRTPRRAWGTRARGTTSSGPAPPRSGWPCSAGERRVVGTGTDDRGRQRRRGRGVAGRLAGGRDPAGRGIRGDDLAGGRGAAPALRPPAAVQAGAGRELAAREGGAGRSARSSELRVHEVLGRRAVRLDVERAAASRSTTAGADGGRRGAGTRGGTTPLPGTEGLSHATGSSRCARSTTRWPCAPRSPGRTGHGSW